MPSSENELMVISFVSVFILLSSGFSLHKFSYEKNDF